MMECLDQVGHVHACGEGGGEGVCMPAGDCFD